MVFHMVLEIKYFLYCGVLCSVPRRRHFAFWKVDSGPLSVQFVLKCGACMQSSVHGECKTTGLEMS